MADPVFIDIPKDGWEKVAEDVLTGTIWIIDSEPGLYWQTYRMTGNDAPTEREEGVRIECGSMAIGALAAIDVYIWAHGKDGRVRVDL